MIAIACIAVLVAAGWIYLGLMLAGMSGVSVLEALCRPTLGASYPQAAQAALLFAMWCAMVLAMMLPTAGPMILTYADIAETAAQKGEPAASPLVLTAGYVVVWLAAAAALAALQILFARLSLLDPAMASASPLFSGARSSRPVSISSPRSSTPASPNASARSRSFSPTGPPSRAACSGSGCAKASIVLAAAGR